MNLTEVKEHIVKSGLKATHQRMIVLQNLSNDSSHPTAEKLYDSLQMYNPSLSLSTVYRILDDLVEVGLINQVATKGGIKRYDANITPHNHIYCNITNEIFDFYDEELHQVIKDFFEKKQIANFKISDIKMQVNGFKVDLDQKVSFKQ